MFMPLDVVYQGEFLEKVHKSITSSLEENMDAILTMYEEMYLDGDPEKCTDDKEKMKKFLLEKSVNVQNWGFSHLIWGKYFQLGVYFKPVDNEESLMAVVYLDKTLDIKFTAFKKNNE